MTVVIGSVPYLNEKPLTRWFKHTEEGKSSGIEVVYAVPSELSSMLARGEIAAALMSSFECLRSTGYKIVPGVSISGQDEILSVRAFSRIPWRFIQSVALDASSLTSSALLKILLADLFDSHPAYVNHPPDLDAMLAVAEAALLIGDPGMLADDDGLITLDLGEGWRKLTGRPFVYACWIGCGDDLTPGLVRTLQAAKEWGLTQVDEIAREEAERLGCPAALCRRYLTEIMDYDLGEEELAGLDEFASRAFHHQLIPSIPVIEVANAR